MEGRKGGRKDTNYPSLWSPATTQSTTHWIYCTLSCGSRHSDCHSDAAVRTVILTTCLQKLSVTTWLFLLQKHIILADTRDPRATAASSMVNSGLQRTDTIKLLADLLPKAFLVKRRVLNYVFKNAVTTLNFLKHGMYLKHQVCINFLTQKILV